MQNYNELFYLKPNFRKEKISTKQITTQLTTKIDN